MWSRCYFCERPQRMKHRMPKLVGRSRPLYPKQSLEQDAASKLKHSVLALRFSKILLRRSNVIGIQKLNSSMFDICPTQLHSDGFCHAPTYLWVEREAEINTHACSVCKWAEEIRDVIPVKTALYSQGMSMKTTFKNYLITILRDLFISIYSENRVCKLRLS